MLYFYTVIDPLAMTDVQIEKTLRKYLSTTTYKPKLPTKEYRKAYYNSNRELNQCPKCPRMKLAASPLCRSCARKKVWRLKKQGTS